MKKPIELELKRPVRVDLICWKGKAWQRNLRYKWTTSKETVDLTGWTAKVDIRPDENSDTLCAEMYAGVTGVDGMISLALRPEQTAQLWPGTYHYDLKTIDENGEPDYWIYGKFIVKGRTTV